MTEFIISSWYEDVPIKWEKLVQAQAGSIIKIQLVSPKSNLVKNHEIYPWLVENQLLKRITLRKVWTFVDRKPHNFPWQLTCRCQVDLFLRFASDSYATLYKLKFM